MRAQESPDSSRAIQNPGADGGTLRVVCLSTYVADRSRQTARHVDVRNFLLALRGERVEGVSTIPVGAEKRSLSATNANDSIDWFGEMVVHYLAGNGIGAPLAIVPVPTSRATVDSNAGPWTSLLAISIASNGLGEADVVDVLRWQRPVPPPSRRTATAAELYQNLAVTRPLAPEVPVLLVDYLYTSSATLRACAARVKEQGAKVLLALCAGRTTNEIDHDAFSVVVGDLSPFEPGH